MRSRLAVIAVAAGVALVSLQSCFTGVESTPKISLSDVRKQQAATVTDEQRFLAGLAPTPPSKWRPGHRLRVDDAKIGLALTSASASADSLPGRDLVFDSFSPAVSLTGTDATEISFHADLPGGRAEYFYRVSVDMSELDTLEAIHVPFTVDMDLVARVDSMMRGRRLYVRTPMWYGADGDRSAVAGLRHVPVVVDSVVAGDSNYPLGVVFTLVDADQARLLEPSGEECTRMVFMTVGKSRAATRNFDLLFSFRDPREIYPGIKDDIWQLIVRSRVKEGMTREECRLALGAPTTLRRIPTYGGMREQWQYSDGVYLYFDDGFLTRYRL